MTDLIFSKVSSALFFFLMFFLSARLYGISEGVILYIDPGTGSLFFQILSAIILAILFYLSLIKKTIAKLFNKVKRIFVKESVDV
ncbi:MAG: hypothetical protein FD143_1708 [Ignavibacteria bacterium]|nr:MAG: hypothetical protein FD143_1708 [Ignavibacteria bacterium]KAF0160056.1 MAG: hypothetical protein FD188_1870 [Ignavibacteria bacterium]